MKNYLFILRQLPHISGRLQETLDQILTTAAFDQSVTLLFMDDGVYQLMSRQAPSKLGSKDTAAIFKVLEIYDVKQLLVEQESLTERGLDVGDLILPVQLIERRNIGALMAGNEVLIPD